MSLPAYEFRTYTLASAEAVEAYATEYYPRHVVSLRDLFGVTVHGFWTVTGGNAPQFSVLMSYPSGTDPDQVRQQYRVHPVAAANMPGFDPSVIRNVSITMLAPAEGSPLR
jgi:hypothetical protein